MSKKHDETEEEIVEVIDLPDVPEQEAANQNVKPDGQDDAQKSTKCAADYTPGKAMKDEKHHANVAIVLAVMAIIFLILGRFGLARIAMYICAFVFGLIAFILDYRTREHSRKVVTGLVLGLLAVVLSLYSCAALPGMLHRSTHRSYLIEEIIR